MEIVQVLFFWAFITLAYYLTPLIFAKRWKIHEQHYFLGYNPRLFDVNLFGVKFSVGLYLPLAGIFKIYKIENGHKVRVRHTWEFFEHSLLKRFVVTISSIISLILTSILIFVVLTYNEEDRYISKEEVNKHGIYPSALAEKSGLKRGDKILAINGEDYERYEDLLSPELLFKEESFYTILREGKEIDLPIMGFSIEEILKQERPYVSLLIPFEITEVFPGSPAEKAGLITGDVITRVNDEPIIKIYDFEKAVEDDIDGSISLDIERGQNDSENVTAVITVAENHYTGIRIREKVDFVTKENSLIEAIAKGFVRPFKTLETQIHGFYKIMSGNLTHQKSVSGPIGMAEAFGDYRWRRFWTITGLLCITTAFLNLAPLPNTVFWKVIPIVYEGLSRKRYSYDLYKSTRKVGFVILILLMVWFFVNDIIRAF